MPVPGEDSRGYFGGIDMPTISTVVKLWPRDDREAVIKVRAVQNALNSTSLHLDISLSFIVFTREFVI